MSHTDDGQLHTFLDGELTPDEEAGLREHLATCADCRGRLDAARVTRTRAHEILRFADPVRVDQPDFAAVLARRAAGAGAGATAMPRRGAPLRPLLLPWAASVVLAVGAGWFAQQLIRGGGGGDGGALDQRVATFEAQESRAAPQVETAPAVSGMEDRATSTGAAVGAGADAVGGGRAADARAESAAPPPTPTPAPLAVRSAPSVSRRGGAAEADESASNAGDLGAASGAVASPAGRLEEQQVALEGIVVTGMDDGSRQRAAMQAEAAPPAAPPPPPVVSAPSTQPWPQSWRLVDVTEATAALGQPPRVVADLAVVAHHLAADGSSAVRVTQRLPDGSPLEVLQRRARAAMTERAGAGEGAASERELGFTEAGLEMVLRAAVAPDSLRRLRQALIPSP